jgi:hypothetical protein
MNDTDQLESTLFEASTLDLLDRPFSEWISAVFKKKDPQKIEELPDAASDQKIEHVDSASSDATVVIDTYS